MRTRSPLALPAGVQDVMKVLLSALLAALAAACSGPGGLFRQYEYEEEVRDGLLIRRSPEYVYYNTINRIGNWKGSLLGGHKPPPAELRPVAA